MDKKEYEADLHRRQEQHLRDVYRNMGVGDEGWIPCMHDQCPECLGTGVKHDGTPCVHSISCPCPRCSPRCDARS
jgi:acetone carboxylase gamma subunit